MNQINLSGKWSFYLDKEKFGIEKQFYRESFLETINLPATVSSAKKGIPSDEADTGYLMDPYQFEGYTWCSRMVEFPDAAAKELFLVLERTRISHVWIDDKYIGSSNSLCTAHRYRLTPYISKPVHKLTIMVDNTAYPVKGGHMTSPDTQTNWNGITGGIYIDVLDSVYLSGVKIYPDAAKKMITVKAVLNGAAQHTVTAFVSDSSQSMRIADYQLNEGENTFTYPLDESARLWSEDSPYLYQLHLVLSIDSSNSQQYDYSFGLRDFRAAGKYFEINGERTFLRGKHDGMIFPITGYAPTDLDSWLKVFSTAKKYGINHYRFHTCCPPEAAFAAADRMGIYLEPELPFWGTVTEEGEKGHDGKAQQFLIEEGFRILDEFGNHPSFVMMSLGNELWGSRTRLNEILGGYKKQDNRHLYTQGSNNFQFMPCILENDDFFCGVRFSRDRLIRGSYAMCDAPQGHIQTKHPDMIHHYDSLIRPDNISAEGASGGDVTIQYGTGTKTVKMEAAEELIPQLPVVSHEIGQYAMYPDYSEISRYTGVMKPKNLKIFRKRLENQGMLGMAERFFKASGRFAAECYKAEIETAMRSNELAGFQLLDLQDFTGQGTALVGILNAFLENKGLISDSEWRQFCSDTVILAELPKLVFRAGENVNIGIKLAHFAPEPVVNPNVKLTIEDEDDTILLEEKTLQGRYSRGIFRICELDVTMPEISRPKRLTIKIAVKGTAIENHYDIWLYPECSNWNSYSDVLITDSIEEACVYLKQGRKVLLYPGNLNASNSIEGTYCTDFWCYPMFRSISESMNKPVPVGTLGLLIDQKHPAFHDFPSQNYTTPQWYDIIMNSRSLILDETDIAPMVWSIDNFERNHRLGMIFEGKAYAGYLLVCTSDLRKLNDSLPAKWLEYSLLNYLCSDQFAPEAEIDILKLEQLLKL